MKNFSRIWVCGDIHGNALHIENFYYRNKNTINFSKNTDCIILLGDVGINYYLDKQDIRLKKRLGEYPFTYFCIRGNHEQRPSIIKNENKKEWDYENFFNGTVLIEKKYPYIKYALDMPAIYTINSYKTLTLPGAYSVDKLHRLRNGWNWFPQEQLTKEEMDWGKMLAAAHQEVDLVLSHTCPICYEPTDLFLSIIDQSTVDKTMERYLGEIEYILDYKCWIWGHFHQYRRYPITNDNRLRIMLSAGKEMINLEETIENINDYNKLY